MTSIIVTLSLVWLVQSAEASRRRISSSSPVSTHVPNNKKEEEEEAPPPLLPPQCGVYFATSTVPGAGNGIFAGRNYVKGDAVIPLDFIVPVLDYDFHNSGKEYLWVEYVYDPESFQGLLEEALDVNGASFGVGTSMNCNFATNNFRNKYDNQFPRGASWSHPTAPMGSHAGAGASTMFHDIEGYATMDIAQGTELFGSYGEAFFKDNKKYAGVPLTEHFTQGRQVLTAFRRLSDSLTTRHGIANNENNHLPGNDVLANGVKAYQNATLWMEDVLSLVHTLQHIWDSTVLKTLPDDVSKVEPTLNEGFFHAHIDKTIRSIEWLNEHGSCADILQEKVSTIPHAGRGAFASRHIAKGETISPAPLLHFEDRASLNMYHPMSGNNHHFLHAKTELPNVTGGAIHQQLLLNYCFGHADTDVLLCPYMSTALINHSKEQANAKIIWSDKHTMHPEWLEMEPSQWAYHGVAGLAWEFVATRDILEGEEVLIDYGDEWEMAWQEHVANWSAAVRSDCIPVNAFDLNENHEDIVFPTISEGVGAFSALNENYCDTSKISNSQFPELNCYIKPLVTLGLSQLHYDPGETLYGCRVVDRYFDERGMPLYTVEALDRYDPLKDPYHYFKSDDYDDSDTCIEYMDGVLFHVPAGGLFHFVDRPYSRDSAKPWSFRHDMQIPDELLPRAWRRRDFGKAATATAPTNTARTVNKSKTTTTAVNPDSSDACLPTNAANVTGGTCDRDESTGILNNENPS
ncbi:hypothetical protein ACA910_015643 [Epithemia clementina (nom. ined.)]